MIEKELKEINVEMFLENPDIMKKVKETIKLSNMVQHQV
jgi:hypothetical protein